MRDITAFACVIGIDIAKLVMQLYILTADGAVFNKSVKRKEFLDEFRNREACLIGMEACGGSQYWARELQKLGHTVILMPPKSVKPFVRGMKNDRNDAEGIFHALINEVRQVPIKNATQQYLAALLTMRHKLMQGKVSGINHFRGILLEYGVTINRSVPAFKKGYAKALETLEQQGNVSPILIEQLRQTAEEILLKIERIKTLEKEIKTLAKSCKNYDRFITAPGVGPITAATMCVLLADPSVFKNGRQFAAYLGLAPMSFGSGGHNFVTSIPKHRCNKRVRALMVQCAHAICQCKIHSPWVDKIMRSKPCKVAVIAIANRLARQLWAMASKGEKWEPRLVLAATPK